MRQSKKRTARISQQKIQKLEEFNKETQNLINKGYVPYYVRYNNGNDQYTRKEMSMAMKQQMCGVEIGEFFLKHDDPRVTPCPKAGDPNRGYVSYGKDNLLPVWVAKLAQSLPYTQRCLEFITELLCGGGLCLMYTIQEWEGNTLKTKLVPIEEAGEYIKKRICELRNNSAKTEEGANEDGEGDEGNSIYVVDNNYKSIDTKSYRRRTDSGKVNIYSDRTYEDVGSNETLLNDAIKEMQEWERTMAEYQQMKKLTDFDLLAEQWANDDAYFAISNLRLVMERGTRSTWGTVGIDDITKMKTLAERPKILAIEYMPNQCCRMEEMDERLRINHTYYAEKWRTAGTIRDERYAPVAYPSIMPNKRWSMLTEYVMNNQTTKDVDTRSVVAMPVYVPSVFSPYYPVAPWWSIFASMLFNLAYDIVRDASTERKNAANLSQIVYINQVWLDTYLNGEDVKDDAEAQQKKEEELYKSIEDFLKNKDNKGGMIIGESYPSDKNGIIKNFEVVNLPRSSSKDNLEDIELVGSCIFFAFGIHGNLVGSFGKNGGSTSGTQQRELTLLKSNQLSPRQRLLLGALNFVRDWDGWTPKCCWKFKQYVLSTLDNSKTGVVESYD